MLSVFGDPSASRPPSVSRATSCSSTVFGNVVLGQQFADAALLSFGAGAVVAEDVDDHGVVGLAQALQFVEHPPDLGVDVLEEAGEHLHQSALERPLRSGMSSQPCMVSARGVSSASAGIQPVAFCRAKTRSR